MWSSCVSEISYCDNTTTSWWCGQFVVNHCDLTNNSHMWCHNFDIIGTPKWPNMVSIILWPHGDAVSLYQHDLTNNSHIWCHNFDIIGTSKWPNMVSIILWPHGDAVSLYQHDLTNNSHMWCHNFDFIGTSKWPNMVSIILWPHGDAWWCSQLVSTWPHKQLTYVMS